MTREIKFRAWDKDNEFMVLSENLMDKDEYFFQFDNFGKIDLIQLQYTNIDDENKTAVIVNSELMQFTNLKDKNGKDIYEGDIVNVDGIKDPHICEFVQKDSGGRFQFTHPKKGVWSCFPNPMIEIIGNIYENSELLK